MAKNDSKAAVAKEVKEVVSEIKMFEAEVNAIAQALAAPFEVAEIKFKPQTVAGNRALAVPFVDARVIQDRLDDVLGVMGWQDSYECLPDGSVVCRLKIRLGEEWIVKEDVGGQSEQPDEGDRRKAAFSDALKRAAVKFGIGRYPYRQKPQWVDYDPQKRQFVRPPVLPLTPDQLAHKATSAPAGPKASQAQPEAPARADVKPAAKAKAEDGQEFHRKLQEYDAKLAEQGLCKAGELVKHIAAAGKKAGFDADMTMWGTKEIQLAREETKTFETRRRETTQKQVA